MSSTPINSIRPIAGAREQATLRAGAAPSGKSAPKAAEHQPAVAEPFDLNVEAPIDAGRVATIRNAIEDGTYSVVPAKIADAMIASGIMLRRPQ
jgi:negative regulator of flagellin synthesis FlgM